MIEFVEIIVFFLSIAPSFIAESKFVAIIIFLYSYFFFGIQ